MCCKLACTHQLLWVVSDPCAATCLACCSWHFFVALHDCAFIFHGRALHKEFMSHGHQHGVIVVVTFSHKHLVDKIGCIVLLCGHSVEALSWSFALVNLVASKPHAFLLVSS